MSNEKINAAIYTKNRTLCCIPEEILQEYSTQSKWEQTDELYWKVKQKIMNLPASDEEKQIEQINLLFQKILDEKKKQPNSGFFVRENVLGAKEIFGTEKKDYNAKILELMKVTYRTYSKYLKQDTNSLQKARKNFFIPDEIKIYYVFDWTLLGTCKEGLAICSDGLHYRFDGTILTRGRIEWKELSQYDIQLYGTGIQLKKKKDEEQKYLCFLKKEDAAQFVDVLCEMQKLYSVENKKCK